MLEAIQACRLGWRQRMFPIPNFGVPSNRNAFLNLMEDLARQLRLGNNLLVHCGGGIGRTGTLAVGLLIFFGMDPKEAEKQVAAVHSAPETALQDQLLVWLDRKLQS
ncbi:MAG: hypothetical protein GY866_12990 [Proteobacteria bacterium]|nr:hypothetical protein [Pseudomonadota bacterium]